MLGSFGCRRWTVSQLDAFQSIRNTTVGTNEWILFSCATDMMESGKALKSVAVEYRNYHFFLSGSLGELPCSLTWVLVVSSKRSMILVVGAVMSEASDAWIDSVGWYRESATSKPESSRFASSTCTFLRLVASHLLILVNAFLKALHIPLTQQQTIPLLFWRGRQKVSRPQHTMSWHDVINMETETSWTWNGNTCRDKRIQLRRTTKRVVQRLLSTCGNQASLGRSCNTRNESSCKREWHVSIVPGAHPYSTPSCWIWFKLLFGSTGTWLMLLQHSSSVLEGGRGTKLSSHQASKNQSNPIHPFSTHAGTIPDSPTLRLNLTTVVSVLWQCLK